MFRAAAECRSTEETRYYLNGVYVAPHPEKGVVLTATDGHRLISLHDEAGKCSAPKIINIDAKAIDVTAYNALRKAMPGETPRIVVGEDGIVTVGTYRSLKSCFIDGSYPDWPLVVRRLLAKAKEGKHAPASYNQKYVASFGKIATMLSPGDSRGCSIRIISFSEMDPSLIRFGGIDYAFGVLMPMRGSPSNEIPIWMKAILEPVASPPVAEPPPEPQPANPEPKEPTTKPKRPAARRPAAKRKPSRPVKKTKKRRAA
jgi:hypothetical protein